MNNDISPDASFLVEKKYLNWKPTTGKIILAITIIGGLSAIVFVAIHYSHPSHPHCFQILSQVTFQIKGPLYPAIALTVIAGGLYTAYRLHDHYFQKWKQEQVRILQPLANQLLEQNDPTPVFTAWQELAQNAPNKWFGHPLGLWHEVLKQELNQFNQDDPDTTCINAMERYSKNRFHNLQDDSWLLEIDTKIWAPLQTNERVAACITKWGNAANAELNAFVEPIPECETVEVIQKKFEQLIQWGSSIYPLVWCNPKTIFQDQLYNTLVYSDDKDHQKRSIIFLERWQQQQAKDTLNNLWINEDVYTQNKQAFQELWQYKHVARCWELIDDRLQYNEDVITCDSGLEEKYQNIFDAYGKEIQDQIGSRQNIFITALNRIKGKTAFIFCESYRQGTKQSLINSEMWGQNGCIAIFNQAKTYWHTEIAKRLNSLSTIIDVETWFLKWQPNAWNTYHYDLPNSNDAPSLVAVLATEKVQNAEDPLFFASIQEQTHAHSLPCLTLRSSKLENTKTCGQAMVKKIQEARNVCLQTFMNSDGVYRHGWTLRLDENRVIEPSSWKQFWPATNPYQQFCLQSLERYLEHQSFSYRNPFTFIGMDTLTRALVVMTRTTEAKQNKAEAKLDQAAFIDAIHLYEVMENAPISQLNLDFSIDYLKQAYSEMKLSGPDHAMKRWQMRCRLLLIAIECDENQTYIAQLLRVTKKIREQTSKFSIVEQNAIRPDINKLENYIRNSSIQEQSALDLKSPAAISLDKLIQRVPPKDPQIPDPVISRTIHLDSKIADQNLYATLIDTPADIKNYLQTAQAARDVYTNTLKSIPSIEENRVAELEASLCHACNLFSANLKNMSTRSRVDTPDAIVAECCNWILLIFRCYTNTQREGLSVPMIVAALGLFEMIQQMVGSHQTRSSTTPPIYIDSGPLLAALEDPHLQLGAHGALLLSKIRAFQQKANIPIWNSTKTNQSKYDEPVVNNAKLACIAILLMLAPYRYATIPSQKGSDNEDPYQLKKNQLDAFKQFIKNQCGEESLRKTIWNKLGSDLRLQEVKKNLEEAVTNTNALFSPFHSMAYTCAPGDALNSTITGAMINNHGAQDSLYLHNGNPCNKNDMNPATGPYHTPITLLSCRGDELPTIMYKGVPRSGDDVRALLLLSTDRVGRVFSGLRFFSQQGVQYLDDAFFKNLICNILFFGDALHQASLLDPHSIFPFLSAFYQNAEIPLSLRIKICATSIEIIENQEAKAAMVTWCKEQFPKIDVNSLNLEDQQDIAGALALRIAAEEKPTDQEIVLFFQIWISLGSQPSNSTLSHVKSNIQSLLLAHEKKFLPDNMQQLMPQITGIQGPWSQATIEGKPSTWVWIAQNSPIELFHGYAETKRYQRLDAYTSALLERRGISQLLLKEPHISFPLANDGRHLSIQDGNQTVTIQSSRTEDLAIWITSPDTIMRWVPINYLQKSLLPSFLQQTDCWIVSAPNKTDYYLQFFDTEGQLIGKGKLNEDNIEDLRLQSYPHHTVVQYDQKNEFHKLHPAICYLMNTTSNQCDTVLIGPHGDVTYNQHGMVWQSLMYPGYRLVPFQSHAAKIGLDLYFPHAHILYNPDAAQYCLVVYPYTYQAVDATLSATAKIRAKHAPTYDRVSELAPTAWVYTFSEAGVFLSDSVSPIQILYLGYLSFIQSQFAQAREYCQDAFLLLDAWDPRLDKIVEAFSSWEPGNKQGIAQKVFCHELSLLVHQCKGWLNSTESSLIELWQAIPQLVQNEKDIDGLLKNNSTIQFPMGSSARKYIQELQDKSAYIPGTEEIEIRIGIERYYMEHSQKWVEPVPTPPSFDWSTLSLYRRDIPPYFFLSQTPSSIENVQQQSGQDVLISHVLRCLAAELPQSTILQQMQRDLSTPLENPTIPHTQQIHLADLNRLRQSIEQEKTQIADLIQFKGQGVRTVSKHPLDGHLAQLLWCYQMNDFSLLNEHAQITNEKKLSEHIYNFLKLNRLLQQTTRLTTAIQKNQEKPSAIAQAALEQIENQKEYYDPEQANHASTSEEKKITRVLLVLENALGILLTKQQVVHIQNQLISGGQFQHEMLGGGKSSVITPSLVALWMIRYPSHMIGVCYTTDLFETQTPILRQLLSRVNKQRVMPMVYKGITKMNLISIYFLLERLHKLAETNGHVVCTMGDLSSLLSQSTKSLLSTEQITTPKEFEAYQQQQQAWFNLLQFLRNKVSFVSDEYDALTSVATQYNIAIGSAKTLEDSDYHLPLQVAKTILGAPDTKKWKKWFTDLNVELRFMPQDLREACKEYILSQIGPEIEPFLTTVWPRTFTMHVGISFGKRPDSKIVSPYRASATPSPKGTAFSHLGTQIWTTLLWYMKQGVDPSLVDLCRLQVQRARSKYSETLEAWTHQETSDAVRSFRNPAYFIAFLTEQVFPAMDLYPEMIIGDVYRVVKNCLRIWGASGTPPAVLPGLIRDSSDPIPLQPGALSSTLLRLARGCQATILYYSSPDDIAALLKKHLRVGAAMVDGAPCFPGQDTREVAIRIASSTNMPTLFRSVEGTWWIATSDGQISPAKADDAHKCIVYLGDRDCRGVDVVLLKDSLNIISLNDEMTWNTFAQTVGRLRSLGEGQRCYLLVSSNGVLGKSLQENPPDTVEHLLTKILKQILVNTDTTQQQEMNQAYKMDMESILYQMTRDVCYTIIHLISKDPLTKPSQWCNWFNQYAQPLLVYHSNNAPISNLTLLYQHVDKQIDNFQNQLSKFPDFIQNACSIQIQNAKKNLATIYTSVAGLSVQDLDIGIGQQVVEAEQQIEAKQEVHQEVHQEVIVAARSNTTIPQNRETSFCLRHTPESTTQFPPVISSLNVNPKDYHVASVLELLTKISPKPIKQGGLSYEGLSYAGLPIQNIAPVHITLNTLKLDYARIFCLGTDWSCASNILWWNRKPQSQLHFVAINKDTNPYPLSTEICVIVKPGPDKLVERMTFLVTHPIAGASEFRKYVLAATASDEKTPAIFYISAGDQRNYCEIIPQQFSKEYESDPSPIQKTLAWLKLMIWNGVYFLDEDLTYLKAQALPFLPQYYNNVKTNNFYDRRP